MQGLNKTKAALQGRQCNYKKLKPSQITTLIDQVNNLGRVKGCSEVSNGHKLTAPLAQLIRDARISAHTFLNCGKLTVIPSEILRPLISLAFSQSKSFASWWVYPNLDRPDMSDSPQWGTSKPMADTLKRNSGLAEGEIPPSKQNHRAIVQPFGSMLEQSTNLPKPLDSGSGHNLTSPDTSPFSHVMPALPKYKAVTTTAIQSNLFGILCKLLFGPQPFSSISRCLSSFLIMRFIQAASDSSPSCRWASSIKSRSSGSSRNWNGGLPRLSFLCVDTLSTPDVMCLCVMTHYMHMNEKATPRSAETLPRRLTTNDRISIEVAVLNHTQTRPKYQYRFLALHRSDRSAAPCRLSVEAFTEKEARQVLSAHFILSLAARLPVSEVRHA